ncbi:PDZ domain-containing protein [Bradyrhizobium sp. LHD-71]|uniref:S1C family serine protease n=1 Tax=Bradyrhizobium sp. LHD-71 TaxID=3072141 RepID=UPI00280E0383|nr:PDZ domain-containing protein [Bradyrhizobium sp. LHD-71]MDQ8727960.1 PDZ domain-containing protein [Bradyrhizobium sp. LHD-71]
MIGVNSAIVSPTGGSIGIGFAIPAETVKTVAATLKDKGTVSRGWIGVQIQTMSPEIARGLGVDQQIEGTLVADVELESPAASAGLAPGDIVTSFAGAPTTSDRDLSRRAADLAPGTSVKLGIVRKNKEMTVDVTLGELPNARGKVGGTQVKANETRAAGSDATSVGLTLVPANDLLGPRA